MKVRLVLQIIFLSSLLINGCKQSNETSADTSAENADLITVNLTQFETAGMVIGSLEKKIFSETVNVRGMISAPPNGMAGVSSFVTGNAGRIFINIGDYVSKGQLLLTVNSPEFIRLQQEYAETEARLIPARAEFERQKMLAGDSISSRKALLNAEGEYKSLKARHEGLKANLALLGADKTPGDGFQRELRIVSPVSGYVSSINVEAGHPVSPGESLLEITDPGQLQLNLFVFEKDIYLLKEGQPVVFSGTGKNAGNCTATIKTYSRAIDPETKSITAIAGIDSGCRNLVAGMYVEASIAVNSSEGTALPDEAILKSGDARIVLVKTGESSGEIRFKPHRITTGRSYGGFTEILNPEGLDEVLVKGGFNLITED